ncbi:DNA-binding protein [Rhodococcus oxybenzonivorans]|uniref:DNA-binding protein n=1 Tax=Rhodococcus oxybenzonivorans TaxID=1990687 RepID=A0A2S2BV64_9NOCA|nr:DNA-binding protein [Rhodococcus oxybenzonivorans]AWK72511.1 DNA-binding protein [Rhodococcus oxybenzonivorans]
MGTIDDRYLAGDVDFEAAVGEALGTPVSRETMLPLLHALRRGAHPNAQLSDHDAALYDAAGFSEDPLAPAAAAAERERRMRELTASAKTVEEVARLLGVSTSRIRQRAGTGSVWTIKVGNKLLLPAVQFTGAAMVPNLDRILTALPDGLHPLALERALTDPRADLALDGRPVSVIDWLASGGDVETALEVIAQIEWEAA